eukprot:11029397-Alexandrium_andersonii.AAC.1
MECVLKIQRVEFDAEGRCVSEREYDMMRRLRHPCIMTAFARFIVTQSVDAVVLPFMGGGDLNTFIW